MSTDLSFTSFFAKNFDSKRLFTVFFAPMFLAFAVFSSTVYAQDITTFNNMQLDGDTDETTNPAVPLDGIAGLTDWDEVYFDCVTNGDCTTITTGALRQAFVDDSGTDYTVFDGGIKDILPISSWTCNESPVQGKSDILHAYGATFVEPTDPTDQLVFYGGADRDTNTGTANFGIWLFQNPVGCDSFPNAGASTAFTGQHTDGDLLLVAEFDQGGSVSTINVFRWSVGPDGLPETADDCLGGDGRPGDLDPNDCDLEGETFATGLNCDNAMAGDQVCGTTNDANEIDADWRMGTPAGTGIPTNAFYEAGSNLSDLIGNENLGCFATAMIETRSSTSLTATLKDFAFLDLSTCGTLDVVKQTVGGDDTFGFTVSPTAGGPDAFDLMDGQSQFFPTVESGDYSIAEGTVPSNWTLTDIECLDGDGVEVTDNGGVTDGVNISIGLDDDITCTFTNTADATLTVVKQVTGPDETFDFNWSSTNGGSNDFQLTTSGGSSAGDPDETYDISALVGDTDLSISEDLAADPDYIFVNASCSDQDGPVGTPDGVDSVDGITVEAGDNIVCTFNNQSTGTVVINKVVVGGDDTFNYTVSPAFPAPFNGDFDIAATEGGGGTTGDILNLTPGTYTLTETDPQTTPGGWDFTNLSCSDPGDNGSSVLGRVATIDLDAGETISCTYTNTKRGSITVIKTSEGLDNTFSFTGTGPSAFDFGGGFDITTVGNTSDPGNNAVFTNLELGTYSLAESAEAGWDLDTATCEGDGEGTTSPDSINLEAGEDVVCTFHNIQRGSIEIVKSITAWDSLSPQPPSKVFTFDAGGSFRFDGVGGIDVQETLEPADQDNNATTGAIEVIPGGTYSVSEADPTSAGWALITPMTCEDGSPASAIDVSPGEAVVCIFTNQPLGSTIVRKTSVGGEGSFGFTWPANVPEGEISTFSIDTTGDGGTDTADFSYKLLINSQYDLTETSVPAAAGDYLQGWSLTNVGCVDEPSDDSLVPGNNGSDATIIADTGETVSCTFTNTLDGALVIRKETIPDGVDADFTFSGSVSGDIRDYSTFNGSPDSEELSVTGQPSGAPYTATETIPNGWTLSNINCVAEDGVLNSGVTIGADNVSVDTLAAGEVVICTFTNTLEGSITIIKDVVGADQSFNFTATYDDDGFSLSDNQFDDSGPLQSGNYTITETAANSNGYALTDISCPGEFNSTINTSVNGVTIGLTDGEDITCTFTNTELATITLEKTVVNDNGGTLVQADFPSFLDGAPKAWDVTTEVLPNVEYTASETPQFGYAAGVWGGGCAADGTVTPAPGEDVTCTITNNDIAPTLQLLKTVINDDGGTLTQSDFPSFVDGSPQAWDVVAAHSAGNHTASETPQFGYAAGSWGGDCAADGTVSMTVGNAYVCTITNNDIAPTLQLVKTVINDNGGLLDQSDFPSFVDGSPQAWDVVTAHSAGNHTASETPQFGYAAGSWGGDCAADGTVSMTVGNAYVCTITNNDIQPLLTVTKMVVNDNGGTLSVADFPLFVDATGVDSGVQNGFNAGIYTVSETEDPGYAASAWGGDCAPDGSIGLEVGDELSCVITNNDITAHLILIKQVDNHFGGTGEPTDWLLSADGPTPISDNGFVEGDVNAGLYNLSEELLNESVQAGGIYITDGWVCPGANLIGDQLTLELAEVVTCTITNQFIPATPVPVNNPWALLMMILTLLATGWYFRPAYQKRF